MEENNAGESEMKPIQINPKASASTILLLTRPEAFKFANLAAKDF